MKRAPGFMQAFLIDGKAPEAGARLKQTAFAATLEHLAKPGSTISIAAMSAARSPPIWSASAAR